MVRRCANCHCEDAPYYDFLQRCTCGANPANHSASAHAPSCFRIRHRVIPYRVKLRKYKQVDGNPDASGLIQIPADQKYYEAKGFHGRVHSGYLWAEKLLCAPCIQQWEAAQHQRRLYQERVASFNQVDTETYYQMLARN